MSLNITPSSAKDTMHDLVKHKSPEILSPSRLGSIYLNCIGCNIKRFDSIEDSRGNDNMFWCKPCFDKVFPIIEKLNENRGDPEWDSIAKLFNQILNSQ